MSHESSQFPPDPASFDYQMSELELYLDDQLVGEAKARFEARLSRDATLMGQVQRQREIDGSLRRMFVAPTAPELASGNGQAAHPTLRIGPQAAPSQRRPLVRKPLLIAASIIILVCGPFIAYFAWDSYNAPKPGLQYTAKPVQPLDLAYRQEVAAGFKCDWECKTDREFATTFAAQLGQPLLMHKPPQEVVSLGLSYSGGISTRSLGFLATVSGQPVMVFADRIEAGSAAGQSLSDPRGLNMFKRQVGSIVLYEVTPLDKPALLDLFYEPKMITN